MAELRQVVRGIYPPVLTDRGLDGAITALAAGSAVPVRIEVAPAGGCPPPWRPPPTSPSPRR